LKALLTAIKSELPNNLAWVRAGDVYITPDVDFIPPGTRYPCIGIKDGTIRRRELPGNMLEVTLTVTLAVYVQLLKPEASIMGDGNKPGVLDAAADIHGVLDENLLNITDMQKAFSPNEDDSQMASDDKRLLQSKLITYHYVKEEDRP